MKKEIERLFLSAKQLSRMYNEDQIIDLPDPVIRYFKYALPPNQQHISFARLKHSGQFKPSKKWSSINGEEYFTVQPPGFAWFGRIRFVSAKDTYFEGSGRMQIKLLSLLKLVDAKGEDYNQGELVRWLSETPWFPTALLPAENLTWQAEDDGSAKVILTDSNLRVEAMFFFNEKGQITKFKTKRFSNGKFQDWICQYHDYCEVEGMTIPFVAEASWGSESEESKYAKFRLEEIEYDNPSKYDF